MKLAWLSGLPESPTVEMLVNQHEKYVYGISELTSFKYYKNFPVGDSFFRFSINNRPFGKKFKTYEEMSTYGKEIFFIPNIDSQMIYIRDKNLLLKDKSLILASSKVLIYISDDEDFHIGKITKIEYTSLGNILIDFISKDINQVINLKVVDYMGGFTDEKGYDYKPSNMYMV